MIILKNKCDRIKKYHQKIITNFQSFARDLRIIFSCFYSNNQQTDISSIIKLELLIGGKKCVVYFFFKAEGSKTKLQEIFSKLVCTKSISNPPPFWRNYDVGSNILSWNFINYSTHLIWDTDLHFQKFAKFLWGRLEEIILKIKKSHLAFNAGKFFKN